MVSTGLKGISAKTSDTSRDIDAPDDRHGIEEPEDILSAFLGVVYNYTPITHSEAGSTFTYTYPGPSIRVVAKGSALDDDEAHLSSVDPITLTLRTPDTRARNWELHASSIWAAAVFLADHVNELNLCGFLRLSKSDGQAIEPDRTFRVLELGAGAGLPGLLIAKSLEIIECDSKARGASTKEWRVTLSDYPDELLIDTLKENVQRNLLDRLDQSRESNPNPKQVRVVPYAWGENISSLTSTGEGDTKGVGFDLIVAADTLWNAGLHDTFARTIYLLLRRTSDARVHLVAGLHTGRYALSGFLRVVRSLHVTKGNDTPKARLDVLDISERAVNGEARREWREDRDVEDDVERRRWTIWIVLGWVDL